jgi:hypothetical protein
MSVSLYAKRRRTNSTARHEGAMRAYNPVLPSACDEYDGRRVDAVDTTQRGQEMWISGFRQGNSERDYVCLPNWMRDILSRVD